MSTEPKRTLQSAPGPIVRIGGRELLYFAGTGYLGLQGHADVIAAGKRAFDELGLHPAASRATCGETDVVREVEARLGSYFGCEDALYVPSGYAGAAILVQSLDVAFDHVFVDEAAHYSVLDGAALGQCEITPFAHLDAGDLETKLAERLPSGPTPLVMTDGVFASTGDIAPLRDYLDVLRRWPDARLLVDDAHGVGVLGPNGRGTVEMFDLLDDPRVLWCGTTSKALGGYGGFVCGTRAFVDRVRSAARWFAGTTPVPSPVAAATAMALTIAEREPERRQRLHANITRLRKGLAAAGYRVARDVPTPIVSLSFGDAGVLQGLHRRLEDAGIFVPYVAAYSGTGPAGALRVAVFATHTESQIDRLVETLAQHAPR